MAYSRIKPWWAGSSAGSISSSPRSVSMASSPSPPRSCSKASWARIASSSWASASRGPAAHSAYGSSGNSSPRYSSWAARYRSTLDSPDASRIPETNASASVQRLPSGHRLRIPSRRTRTPWTPSSVTPSAARATRSAWWRLFRAASAGRSGHRCSVTCSRCMRWPGVSARSLTSSLALRRRHAAAGTARPSTSTSNPPRRRTRTDGRVPPEPAGLCELAIFVPPRGGGYSRGSNRTHGDGGHRASLGATAGRTRDAARAGRTRLDSLAGARCRSLRRDDGHVATDDREPDQHRADRGGDRRRREPRREAPRPGDQARERRTKDRSEGERGAREKCLRRRPERDRRPPRDERGGSDEEQGRAVGEREQHTAQGEDRGPCDEQPLDAHAAHDTPVREHRGDLQDRV